MAKRSRRSAYVLVGICSILMALLLTIGCGSSSSGTAESDPTDGTATLVGINVPLVNCPEDKNYTSPYSAYIEVEGELWDPHYALLKLFPDINGNPAGVPEYCDWESFTITGTIQFNHVTVPEGTYWAVISLEAFYPQCTVVNTSYKSSDTLKTHVADSVCLNFTRRMEIEYDAQRSWSLKGKNSVGYIDSAFARANTLVQMVDDQVNLDDYSPSDTVALLQWINLIHTTAKPMRLIGMPNFDENTLNREGWTLSNDNQVWGEPGCISLVFRRVIREKYSAAPYYWDVETRWEVINKTTIHELGHSRADLSHPNDRPAEHIWTQWCIMNGILIDVGYKLFPDRKFCDSCLARIEAETW